MPRFLFWSSLLCMSIMLCLLLGCTSAMYVGTGGVGAKVITDPRSVGTQIDDGVLSWRINKALSGDEELCRRTRISAVVYQDSILLLGQSPDEDLSAKAHRIVLSMKGGGNVYNEIRLGEPLGYSSMIGDSWLTTKIRSLLLINNMVKSSNVKVVTENKEVFLMGKVSEHEANVIVDIVRRVSGVERVITAFVFVSDLN